MIVKTDAIVLRSRKYRETSRILTLYTKEFGKLSVIAKGARSLKNKFGASLQPLSHVHAVMYKHDHRELHLLSQCDGITRFGKLAEDLEKFTASMYIVELMEYVANDEERNEQFFDLALSTLKAMNDAQKNVANVQFYFEVHLSDVLGFKPQFHSCLSCGRVLNEEDSGTKGGKLWLGNGGVLCSRCSDRADAYGSISISSLKVLQQLQRASDPESVTQMRLSDHQIDEVRTTLRRYLQSHVGGLHRMKSQAVAASIVQDL